MLTEFSDSVFSYRKREDHSPHLPVKDKLL